MFRLGGNVRRNYQNGTNYSEIRIEESIDLTIESGDLVPDVLDLFVS